MNCGESTEYVYCTQHTKTMAKWGDTEDGGGWDYGVV